MDWFTGSIPEAIAEVKNNRKLLLVFVAGEDDLSQKMCVTYDHPDVADKLNECIALKLVANSIPYQQFSQIYPVVVIPSSFFIGKNGLPIEVITGCIEPSDFVEKIEKIFQLNQDNTADDTNSSHSELQTTAVNKSPTSAEQETISVENSSEQSNQPSTSMPMVDAPESCLESEAGSVAEDADRQPLEDRIERAKTLIEARKQAKAVEEQEDLISPSSSSSRKQCISPPPMTESERKRLKVDDTQNSPKENQEEQERRKIGKALQKAAEERRETELKVWAQNRAKEKEEERLARERVKAQIAQDRAERAARYQQAKATEVAAQKEKDLQRMKEEQEKAVRDAALRSTVARLQFRLPDGASVIHQFPADSKLEEARKFVLEEVRPGFSNFTLCTTFPRRHFTDADYSQTLRDLQLAPSAVVMVLPAQTVVVSGGQAGYFGSIFWILVSPLLTIWRAFSSMFRRSTPNETTQSTDPAPGTSGTSAASASATKGENSEDGPVNDGPAVRRREPQGIYREGNIFRINNRPPDDDENNTWNGNSTQQM